jgi:adenosylhomocysteinase
MGARVVVCEVDPYRALEAHFEGYEVLPIVEAARLADVVVSCTGGNDVVGTKHFEVMKDGVILANAGHFDVEVNVKDLKRASVREEEVRPNVTQFTMADGRRLCLLADGRLVNIAAADGHPIEIMDMSFSLQLLSVIHLAKNRGRLQNSVLPVPPEVDLEVATLKLKSEGISIDALSREQKEYLEKWGE